MTVELQITGDDLTHPFRFIGKCDFCYSHVFTRAFKEDGSITVQKLGDYKDIGIICSECKNKIMAKLADL